MTILFKRALSAASLDVIERFFFDRGAPVLHEMSMHAGGAALDLLCARNYRPIEISNVLYRRVEKPTAEERRNISVRVIGPEESELFASISARGWAHEHPELLGFLLQIFREACVSVTRRNAGSSRHPLARTPQIPEHPDDDRGQDARAEPTTGRFSSGRFAIAAGVGLGGRRGEEA
jgi:hypothetical protein